MSDEREEDGQATMRKGECGSREGGGGTGVHLLGTRDGHACVFARSVVHLSVSHGICTPRDACECVCAHSEELAWHPAAGRWVTREGRTGGERRRGRGSRRPEEGAAWRIMRVSTQRARMKARVFSGEGQRIGHEGGTRMPTNNGGRRSMALMVVGHSLTPISFSASNLCSMTENTSGFVSELTAAQVRVGIKLGLATSAAERL